MLTKQKIRMTTIAVSKKNAERLACMRQGYEDYDAVVTRLLNNQVDIPTSMISIDNDLPQLHTCILQLGDDPESLYFYGNNEFKPITLKEANKLMKQPKPYLSLSPQEINTLLGMGYTKSGNEIDNINTSQIRAKMAKFSVLHGELDE